MRAIAIIKGIRDEMKDSDRKEIIEYLIDTMEKPSSLFAVKKYVDDVVEYEKAPI